MLGVAARQAISFLREATLDGQGYFQCFTASSVGYVATFFMYMYVLTSTILLVNMLIAMMSVRGGGMPVIEACNCRRFDIW